MHHVLVVYGTRPEAIKLAPLVSAMRADSRLRATVAVTGQHREMLDQVNTLFGITPDADLDILRPRQTLEDITSRTLQGLAPVLEAERPDCVLVQGDTTTALASAMAGFYHHVPVVHLEAGLRTDRPDDPFPEEMNRRLTSQLSTLHLAPTPRSRTNLLREGVAANSIVVTGNTVIDALHDVIDRTPARRVPELDDLADRRVVLVTSHRRESWGEPMARAGRALAILAERFPDVAFVLPLHLNPVVREVLVPAVRGRKNVLLTEPLDYLDFAHLIHRCTLALTDSGGVQEEAPSLGKPVLVMRETTERPEAVDAGTVRLVGTDVGAIVDGVTELLTDKVAYSRMANAVNPYGDGHAAPRAVAAIAHMFGIGDRAQEFRPELNPG